MDLVAVLLEACVEDNKNGRQLDTSITECLPLTSDQGSTTTTVV